MTFTERFDSYFNARRDANSYLAAKGYIEMGDRTVWEPSDPVDMEEFYQDNDEPFLAFEEQEEF